MLYSIIDLKIASAVTLYLELLLWINHFIHMIGRSSVKLTADQWREADWSILKLAMNQWHEADWSIVKTHYGSMTWSPLVYCKTYYGSMTWSRLVHSNFYQTNYFLWYFIFIHQLVFLTGSNPVKISCPWQHYLADKKRK